MSKKAVSLEDELENYNNKYTDLGNITKTNNKRKKIISRLTVLIFFIVLILFFSILIPYISAKNKMDENVYAYMDLVERDGYLTEENKEEMIEVLNSYGIENIDFGDTTMEADTNDDGIIDLKLEVTGDYSPYSFLEDILSFKLKSYAVYYESDIDTALSE